MLHSASLATPSKECMAYIPQWVRDDNSVLDTGSVRVLDIVRGVGRIITNRVAIEISICSAVSEQSDTVLNSHLHY